MDERAIETLAAQLRGKRWQESDGRRVVEAWRNSGESAGVFARRLGVDEQRLYWWRRRLGHSAAQPAPPPSALEQALAAPVLLPVTIRRGHGAGGGDAALVAEVGAVRIEVHDIEAVPAQWLCGLLSGLREGRS